jgi:hypothetical protein
VSDDNAYNRPESNSTKQKANITRYTSSGNIVFSKNYIDSTPNIPPLGSEPTITAITEGPNETAFMCGQVSRYNSQSNPQDQYDTGRLVAYVAKIDNNTGEVLKASSIDVASTYTGRAEVYELTYVSTDSQGFVYVSGTGYIETPEYNNDWGEIFILFKLNSDLELIGANFVTNANGVYGIQFGKPEISGELIIVPTALGRYFRSDLPQGTESTAAAFAFKRSDIGANTVGKLASKNYGGDAIFQSEDATSYFETVPMTFEVGEQTNTLANVNITTTSPVGSLEANVIADHDIYELVSIEPPPPPMTQIIIYSDGTNTPVVTNGPSVTYVEDVGSQLNGGPFGEPYFQSPLFEVLGSPLGFGTGDYTVETWYRRVSTADQRPQIITWASTREVGMNDDFAIQVWPARVEDEDQVVPPPCILVRTGGMSDFRIQKPVTLGDWRSVVVQRKNNVIEAWENGESISEVWRNVDYIEPIDFGISTKIQMGGNPSTRGPLDIGQTRITIGTALYPSGPTITIPTATFVDVEPPVPVVPQFTLVPAAQYEQDNGLAVQVQSITPFKFYRHIADNNYAFDGTFGDSAPLIETTGGPNGTTALAAVLNGKSSTVSATLDQTVAQITQIPYTVEAFINIGSILPPVPGQFGGLESGYNGFDIQIANRFEIAYYLSYPSAAGQTNGNQLYYLAIFNDFNGLYCYNRAQINFDYNAHFGAIVNSIINTENQWVHIAFTNEPVDGGQVTQSFYFAGTRIYTETGTPYLNQTVQNSNAMFIADLYSNASNQVPRLHGFKYTQSVVYQGASITPPTP